MKTIARAVAVTVVCYGCASAPPTPAQERVERAFTTCNAEVGGAFRLVHVEPSGLFRWEPKGSMAADDAEIPQFQQCLRRHGIRLGGD